MQLLCSCILFLSFKLVRLCFLFVESSRVRFFFLARKGRRHDLKILQLLSKRRKQVLNVIKYKPKSKIVDQARISKMIKERVKIGKKLKLEKFIITKIWLTMISSFIELEKKKYK